MSIEKLSLECKRSFWYFLLWINPLLNHSYKYEDCKILVMWGYFFSLIFKASQYTIKWKYLIGGSQNGLIYISSITDSWDKKMGYFCNFCREILPLGNFKKWRQNLCFLSFQNWFVSSYFAISLRVEGRELISQNVLATIFVVVILYQ